MVIVTHLLVSLQPTFAQQANTALPRVESTNIASGVKLYRGERWGTIKSVVVNPRHIQAEAVLAVRPGKSSPMRFCNRIWLPPLSRRVIYTQVRFPKVKEGNNQLSMESVLIHTIEGQERTGEPHVGAVVLKEHGVSTALLADPGDNDPSRLVAALRQSARQNSTNAILNPADLPATAAGYDALDALFVSGSHPDLDPARMDAIRQWVLKGGRLWIMLGDASPDWVTALLGEDWGLTVIDHVGLTDMVIDEQPDMHRAYDYPVGCWRVLAPTFQANEHIDGHPIALYKRIGQGRLVVTTLEPKAWLEPDDSATPSLQKLTWFLRLENEQTDEHTSTLTAFDGYLRSLIAYTIMGRGPVLGVLALLTLMIAVSALWLARRARIEFVAISSIGTSIIAAAVIVLMGMSRQSATPTSIVSTHMIRYADRQPYAEVDSLVGVFTSPTDISMSGLVTIVPGGTAVPDLSGLGSGDVRLVWTDPDHASFENLEWPSGAVRRIALQHSLTVEEPVCVELSFDEHGVTGRMDDGLRYHPRDPLIVTGTGLIAPGLDPDGQVRAGLDQILETGQYMSARLMDRSSIARQDVYRRLLTDRTPEMPTSVYLWLERDPGGLEMGGGAYQHAEALAVLPVKLLRPPSGSRVCVPAPFVRMSPFRGSLEGGLIPSVIYNTQTGQWYTGLSEPMLVLMRYDVPEALKPFRIESARLSFDLRAPGRDYQIVRVDGSTPKTFLGGSNQLGKMTVDLQGETSPLPQSDGSIIVGVNVGPFADPRVSRGWSLESLTLSIFGVVE